MPGRARADRARCRAGGRNAPNEPASAATTDIAYAWSRTSSTRAGAEIGFGSCDETVSSCVVVQNRESPSVVIPVPSAPRSKTRMSTLATASKTTDATRRNTTRERRCSCVGVAPRATITTSRPRARRGSRTEVSIPGGSVDRRPSLPRLNSARHRRAHAGAAAWMAGDLNRVNVCGDDRGRQRRHHRPGDRQVGWSLSSDRRTSDRRAAVSIERGQLAYSSRNELQEA